MQDTNTPRVDHRPVLAHIYGLRLFYQPRRRRQISQFLGGMTLLLYCARALQQLLQLHGESLRWDFVQFYRAAQELNRGADPYRAFLATCSGVHWCPGGYIFPPLLAELLRPLAILHLETAAALWLLISHALLGCAILVVWRTVRGWLSPTVLALLLAATLFFLPLYQSLYFLQVAVLLLFLLALAASALVARDVSNRWRSGVWLGLACILRVSPVLLTPVLALPRRDAAGKGRIELGGAVALVATTAVLLLALLLATPATGEYFTTVLPRLSAGTAVLDNQSLPGFVERASQLLLRQTPSSTPITSAAAVVFVGLPWLVAWRRAGTNDPRVRAALFGVFLAAMPVASSITWQHHLVSELLVYPLLAPLLIAASPQRAGRLALKLAVVSYPMMWVDRHITDAIVIGLHLNQPSGLRIIPFLLITSLNLWGAICLWGASLLLLSSAGQEVDRDPVAIRVGPD